MPKETFYNLPQDKRQRIINAAIDKFSKEHYSNVTINAIVKAAGIPKGSFYQYFENKDDLYIHLFTGMGDEKIDLFQRLKTKIAAISFKDYMMSYIAELKKLEASNEQIARLKREFLNECPQEIKKQILKVEMPKSIEAYRDVIQLYVDKGEFRRDLDAKVAAYITVMGISNLENYDYSESEDVLSVLTRIIDFLSNSMY